MSSHLTHHGDSDWRFGLCGSATLQSHSDPGQSRSDSEQVHKLGDVHMGKSNVKSQHKTYYTKITTHNEHSYVQGL